MISTDYAFLDEIEKRLLPPTASFSDQQKEVLSYDDNANVVAGPGSGKTTVLTAKCAMLLKKNIGSSKGICLITHTNVAVDEIKIGLSKLGFNNIEYPNFIGTIQEFFNYFFSKKAFHLIFGDKNLRVMDDDEYRDRFDFYFNRLKPKWYTNQNPNVKKRNPRLIINQDLTFNIISSANYTYQDAFNSSIESILKLGIITNKQCLELAEWYIKEHLSEIRNALKNRFEFVLLDEAQDTSNQQYELLNKLFLNNVTFQRFGDPYQALYSIFGSTEEDTWKPSEEVNEITKIDIAETSRFDGKIANLVRNVCIEEYQSFTSISSNNSFKPYFITYNNGQELKEKYKSLINTLEGTSPEYKLLNKKDAILSAKHEDLTSLFEEYIKSNSKIKKSESIVKQIYNFFVRIISKELDLNFQQAEEKLNSTLENRKKLASLIKEFIFNKDIENTILNIIQEMEKLKTKTIETSIKEKIKNQLNGFKVEIESIRINNEFEQSTNEEIIYTGTVHSVKGETHRSTLLVLNTVFTDFRGTYRYEILDLLQNYLLGQYTNPESLPDGVLKRETKNALKLAYVSFSRPTHLVAIGIHIDILTDEFKSKLIEFGWAEW